MRRLIKIKCTFRFIKYSWDLEGSILLGQVDNLVVVVSFVTLSSPEDEEVIAYAPEGDLL
jgi:hypothetical protein